MTVAAGEGPRDWQQDDAHTFPYASGGVHSRPGQRPRTNPTSTVGVRPIAALAIVLGAAAVVAVVVVALVHPTTSAPVAALQPAITQPIMPQPTPVAYPTPQTERAAILASIPYIAGSLMRIANSGGPMPTSFDATDSGKLLAEPSGDVLGPLPYGITIAWVADADGRVTQLTLVGPTFRTRVPLDVSAITLPPQVGTTA